MRRLIAALTGIIFPAFLASLFVLWSPTGALAADNYGSLPAYACRANNKVSQDNFSYGTSRVFNNSFTKTLFVVCSLIKDYDVVDAVDFGNLRAYLQLAPGTSGKCTGYVNFRWGSVIDSHAVNFANPGAFTIDTVLTMSPDTPSGNYYYPSIVCGVPPRSGIRFTRLSEDYDTGVVSATLDEHDIGGFNCRGRDEVEQRSLSYGKARVINNGSEPVVLHCWTMADQDLNLNGADVGNVDIYIHAAVPAGQLMDCRAGRMNSLTLGDYDSVLESFNNMMGATTVNHVFTLSIDGSAGGSMTLTGSIAKRRLVVPFTIFISGKTQRPDLLH